ncbi:MAG: hypothetical protein ACRCW0_08170 [Clostridium sp.]
MIKRSEISYNNRGYGGGKAYIAKITGYDKKYRFKREFVTRDTEYINSSRTTWYKYSWEINESGIYEWYESNAFKEVRIYFKYNNETNECEEINIDEVRRVFPK